MKSNITLVGMPASGKSTIGVLLAKRLGYSFVDVDIVIQEKTGQLLKEIIAERGTEGFLYAESGRLGRLHVTVLRYILNTYTGVITDVFLYLLEFGFHLLTAMRAQKRSCHIVKNMSAHSAISYIHYTSHLPHHNPAPQASVTQYTSDTPWDFSKAAISSSVVPVV